MQHEAEKRACPRYAVSNLDFITARLDRSSSMEQLLTIGAGGCGFVGFDKLWLKSEIKRVVSVFELHLPDRIGPIRVQGNIVYATPVTLNGRPVYYFGVQFLPEDAHRIQPLIEALQKLNQKGEVGLAG